MPTKYCEVDSIASTEVTAPALLAARTDLGHYKSDKCTGYFLLELFSRDRL
jgi:hypothetical protein